MRQQLGKKEGNVFGKRAVGVCMMCFEKCMYGGKKGKGICNASASASASVCFKEKH